MPNTTRRLLVAFAGPAAAVALAGSLIAGCGNDDRGLGDAPVDQAKDRTIPVWPNGNGYPNIAAFCIGGNGIYTTTREAPPAIVIDDPECDRGGILAGTAVDAPIQEQSEAEEIQEDEG